MKLVDALHPSKYLDFPVPMSKAPHAEALAGDGVSCFATGHRLITYLFAPVTSLPDESR